MDSEILRNVPLFSSLPDEKLEYISKILIPRKYTKDTLIVMENDEGDSLFIIREGRVKVTRYSDEGGEVILSILGDDDFFGEMSLLDGEARSANVVALEDTSVFILTRPDLYNLLESKPTIAIAMLEELATRIRRSDKYIKGLSLSDAETRVGMTLFNLSEQMGTIKNGEVTIEKVPYQQDIANMSGTTRETVSRMLKLLEDKHIIEKEGRRITIKDYSQFVKKFG
ncbi:MAG: Crp/Fnr family transcriptional regulator [Candidatus Marinimicrobia bacterium]|nr:Crp/Fnr family transcriptional regulator [Candidatus Neomarinimicrobiota bacterium]